MTADHEALCANLERRSGSYNADGKVVRALLNPHGSKAAALIRKQAEEIAMLRKAAKEAVVERDRLRVALRRIAAMERRTLAPANKMNLIYETAATALEGGGE